MKKLILLIVIVASSATINYSNAQVRFNVNVGLGLPRWIGNVNATAEYYYIPEIDAYYDVTQREFIYMNNGGWAFSAGLPAIFAGFDLYNCQKFPIYASRPYLNDNYYRNYYANYRGTYNENYNRGNYNYHQPAIAYNYNSRINERHDYGRDDRYNRNNYYRNDRRYEERRNEGRDRDNRRH